MKMCIVKQQKLWDSTYPINLHPNEYSQELHYYPFTDKLNRCVGSCNTYMIYITKHVFQIKQKIQI